jgi:hypothetical protein
MLQLFGTGMQVRRGRVRCRRFIWSQLTTPFDAQHEILEQHDLFLRATVVALVVSERSHQWNMHDI